MYETDGGALRALKPGQTRKKWGSYYLWLFELLRDLERDRDFATASGMKLPKGTFRSFSLLPIPKLREKFIALNRESFESLCKLDGIRPVWSEALRGLHKHVGHRVFEYVIQTDGVYAHTLVKSRHPQQRNHRAKGKEEGPAVSFEEVFAGGNTILSIDPGVKTPFFGFRIDVGKDGSPWKVRDVMLSLGYCRHLRREHETIRRANSFFKKRGLLDAEKLLLSMKTASSPGIRLLPCTLSSHEKRIHDEEGTQHPSTSLQMAEKRDHAGS